MCKSNKDKLPIEITFESFQQSKIDDACLIDCRTAEEHEAGHLKGSVLFPLQHLSIRVDELEEFRDHSIYIYCRSGNRSGTFARYLRTIGFLKCQSISGGFEAFGESQDPC